MAVCKLIHVRVLATPSLSPARLHFTMHGPRMLSVGAEEGIGRRRIAVTWRWSGSRRPGQSDANHACMRARDFLRDALFNRLNKREREPCLRRCILN
jgi:hypothetical protein